MDWIIVILGSVMILTGLVGCVFPVIPGPPIAFGGLLLLLFHSGSALHAEIYWWLGAATIAVTALDFVLPVWGTKKFGGTRAGRIGSTIGLIVGLFFTPLMIILGPLIGAIVGELVAGQNRKVAVKSGMGSFLGFLLGTFSKIIVTGFIAYYFVKALTG